MNPNVNKSRRRKSASGAKRKMNQPAAPKKAEAVPDREGEQRDDEGLSSTLQAHIGRHVRAVYDEVAKEPIPEHLLRLLKDLDSAEDK